MSLDTLKSAIPDYAKDLKLNLGSVIGNSDLSAQQLWGTVLATAIASRSPIVLRQLAPRRRRTSRLRRTRRPSPPPRSWR